MAFNSKSILHCLVFASALISGSQAMSNEPISSARTADKQLYAQQTIGAYLQSPAFREYTTKQAGSIAIQAAGIYGIGRLAAGMPHKAASRMALGIVLVAQGAGLIVDGAKFVGLQLGKKGLAALGYMGGKAKLAASKPDPTNTSEPSKPADSNDTADSAKEAQDTHLQQPHSTSTQSPSLNKLLGS